MPVKYNGPDVFYGIPARDMTDEDFDALDPGFKRHVRASDSYEFVSAQAAKKSLKSMTKAELTELATSKGYTLEDGLTNDGIIKAIEDADKAKADAEAEAARVAAEQAKQGTEVNGNA